MCIKMTVMHYCYCEKLSGSNIAATIILFSKSCEIHVVLFLVCKYVLVSSLDSTLEEGKGLVNLG